MSDSGSPSYSQLVLEGVNPALAAHLTILHNQLDGIAERQQKLIADLPEMINAEAAGALRQVITDLRDDSDFNRPLWASGFDHVTDHLATDEGQKRLRSHGFASLVQQWTGLQFKTVVDVAGRWLLVITVIATLSGLMLYLGSTGLLFKAMGAKP